ncbi:MAG TPA: helix-turn-helix transcriptional regulator [Methylobacter sp.]|jgi:DNA-binding CsgD family transcriptional regulator
MTPATQEKIHDIWDELSDFEASQSDQAVALLMKSLCNLANAWNATWGGAVRMDGEHNNDLLQGWRVSAMIQLHPVAPDPDEGLFKEILQLWDRREIDPSFLLPMRSVGTFRTYSFRRELSPEWFESPFYKYHYGSVGTCDAVFIGFPLNQDAESHFGFYSRKTFTDEEVELFSYALRGIKWFHRQRMLSHGLLAAATPLTPTERRVLHLLLTGLPEKQIAEQLERSYHTTHEWIMSIYRKFGVNNRAALMALWLGQTS